jgi:hypothetical protein
MLRQQYVALVDEFRQDQYRVLEKVERALPIRA